MKIPEVILFASHLTFVMCLPQHVQFVRRLRLRQVPTESVSLGFSNDQSQFLPAGLQKFDLSDAKRNQFVNSPLQVVTVTFGKGGDDVSFPTLQFVQDNPTSYGRLVPGPSPQQPRVVIESAFRPRNEHVASTEDQVVSDVQQQQHRFVITPSAETLQDNLGLNEKREEHLPDHQTSIFRSSDVQREPSQLQNDGYHYRKQILENQSIHSPIRIQIHGSPKEQSSLQSLPTNSDEEKLTPLEEKVKESPQIQDSNGVFVARLTAPSNDPKTSNIVMITRKPCVVCCIGNEVEPCRSCCAHTPLLNSQTLKTVVG